MVRLAFFRRGALVALAGLGVILAGCTPATSKGDAAAGQACVHRVTSDSCNAKGSGGQPAVAITRPAATSEVRSGSNVTVSASASAGGAGTVSAVTFYADNYCTGTTTDLGASTAVPYAVQWTNVPVGNFGISAVVTTSQGVSVMSAAIGLTTTSQGFPPPCPVPGGDPAIAIVAPQQNSIVDSNTTVPVTAVVSVGSRYSISSVTFYAVDTCGRNTTLTLGTVTSAPYTVRWVQPAAGTYTLTAIAGTGGMSVSSAPVQIAAGPNRIPPPCPTLPPATTP